MKPTCHQGIENKTRIDNLYSLLQENKHDFKEDISEMKNQIKSMADTANRIFLAVFISSISTLVNIIIIMWRMK